MLQEDGMLRYVEGVDNGEPAHDGTYEAGSISQWAALDSMGTRNEWFMTFYD